MKIIKRLIIVLFVVFLNISFVNAATIKETTNRNDSFDTINNGDIIIGITRFTQGTTITGLRAATAGANFGMFQAKNNLNNELTILINAGAGGWYKMDDKGEVKKTNLNGDLFVYYLNNVEKKVNFSYNDTTVNTSTLPNGITYSGGKFSVPATRLNFSIQTNDGTYIDFASTPYSATNNYVDEVRGHTITYKVYGTRLSSSTVINGDVTVEPEHPTLGTNDFVEWVDSSTGESFTFGSELTTDVTLNAKFIGNSTITVYGNDGNPSYEIEYVLDGTPFKNNASAIKELLITPTKIGHTFNKWCLDISCENEFNLDTTNVTGDISVYPSYNEISYSVSFNGSNDGPTLTYTEDLDLSDYIDTPATGYAFVGWDTDVSADEVIYGPDEVVKQLTTNANGVVSLYAVYTPVTYSLSFNANGGEGAPSSIELTYDGIEDISALSEPTRIGYNFVGWAKTSTATEPDFVDEIDENLSSEADDDVSLYAIWATRDDTAYKVEDYLESLDGLSFVSIGYEIFSGTTLDSVSSSIRTTNHTGFEYDEDNENNIASGNISADGSLILKRYFSRNSYNIYFKVDENIFETVSYKYGETTQALGEEPTKTGYDFDKWLDNANNPYTFGTMPASNFNVYASWTLKTYTISFDVNGGDITTKPSNQTKTYGQNLTITSNSPVKDGYNFASWNTSPDGSGTAYLTGATYTVNEGNTLYAIYTPINYSIDYNWDEVLYGSNSNINSYNIETSIYTLINPERTGYDFVGWTGSNGTTPQLTVTIPSGSTGAKEYVPNWNASSYVATYNYNGATDNISDIFMTVEYDDTYGTLPVPIKPNYTFVKWQAGQYVEDNFVSSYDVTSSTVVSIAADHQLYAVFSPNELTVNLHNNNGETDIYETLACEHGTECSLNYNEFTRTGYSFLGWSTDPLSTTPTYYLTDSPSDLIGDEEGNVDLYAIWRANSYTINYDPNFGSGTTMLSTICTYGSSCQLRANTYTYIYKHFAGWATTSSGQAVYDDEVEVANLATSGTVTLYAVYEDNNYTIKFHKNNDLATGSMEDMVVTEANNNPLPSASFNNVGYDFTYWTTASDGTGYVYHLNDTIVLEDDLTIDLYAQWQAKELEIRVYYSNLTPRCHMEESVEICEEDSEGNPINEYILTERDYYVPVSYGQDVNSSYFEQYTYYPGHTFDGWYYATVERVEDLEGNIQDIYTYGDEFVLGTCSLPTYKNESRCINNEGEWTAAQFTENNILIAARYTPINYTIRLYHNSFNDNSYNDITSTDGINPINYESEVILPILESEGTDEFVGWSVDSFADPDGEITLRLSGCPVENPTCDRRVHLYLRDNLVTPDENNIITLYAVWKTNEPPAEEHIYFDGYGMQCDNEYDESTGTTYCKIDVHNNIIYPEVPNYNISYEIINISDFNLSILDDTDFIKQNRTKPGYSFTSWNEIINRDVCEEDGDDYFCINGDKISKTPYEFYACSLDTESITYEETDCLEASGNWELKNNGVSLMALFSPMTYSIDFNLNGATGTAIDSIDEVITGTSTALPSIDGVTAPSNSTFVGWSYDQFDCDEYNKRCFTSDQEGNIGIESLNLENVEVNEGSITLYAIWEYSSYNVYWDPNDGVTRSLADLEELGLVTHVTVGDSSITLSDADLVDGDNNSFIPEGKRLFGWSPGPLGSPMFGAGMTLNGEAIETSYELNQKLYAIYTDTSTEIEYNLNGGTASAISGSTVGIFGENITLPGNPTKTGYQFLGWRIAQYYDENDEQPLLAGESTILYNFDVFSEKITIDAIFLADWYDAENTSYLIDTQEKLDSLEVTLDYINQDASVSNPITITIKNDSENHSLNLGDTLHIGANVTLIIDRNSSLNIEDEVDRNGAIVVNGTIKVYTNSDNMFNFIGYVSINSDAKMYVNDSIEYVGENGSLVVSPDSNISINVYTQNMQINISGGLTINNDNYFNTDFEDEYFVISSSETFYIYSNSTLTINSNTKLYGNIQGYGELIINDLDNHGPSKTLFRGNMSSINEERLTISNDSRTEIEEQVIPQNIIVNYNMNDGTASVFHINDTSSNSTYTIHAEVPEREGYSFIGWADSANGIVKYLSGNTYNNFAASGVEVNTYNLYAVWVGDWYDSSNTYTLNSTNINEFLRILPYLASLPDGIVATYTGDLVLPTNITIPSNVTLNVIGIADSDYFLTVYGNLVVGIDENDNPNIFANTIEFLDGGTLTTTDGTNEEVIIGVEGVIHATSSSFGVRVHLSDEKLYFDLRNGMFETTRDYSFENLDISPESTITIKHDVAINTALICPGIINIDLGKTLTVNLGATTNIEGTINHDGEYGSYIVIE